VLARDLFPTRPAAAGGNHERPANGVFELTIPAAASGDDLWLMAEPTAACASELGFMRIPPEPLNQIEGTIELLWDPPG